MMDKIQDIAVKTLIASVALLTLIAVLAIWDVLGDDVLWKSLATIGVLAFSSLLILLAVKMVKGHGENADTVESGDNTQNSQ